MESKSLLLASLSLITILFFNNYFAQEFHGGVSVPVYPGGLSALKEFISNNLQYPEKSKKDGVSGTVTLSFLVNEQGEIQNIKILRGINEECDSEAVRVARLIPRWQPAEQWGKHVSAYFNMPVKFDLESKTQNQKDFTITGYITDKANGHPLEGVLIIIKGTNNGTISNKAGYYCFKVPGEDSELEFSAVSYETKSEKIGKNRTINTVLIPHEIVIDFDSDKF